MSDYLDQILRVSCSTCKFFPSVVHACCILGANVGSLQNQEVGIFIHIPKKRVIKLFVGMATRQLDSRLFDVFFVIFNYRGFEVSAFRL